MNKTCPKCGSGSIGDRGLLFYCGNKSTGVYETGKCIQIQRDQLLERNRELEEALEVLLCSAEKVQKKGYFFAQLDGGVVMARAVLAKHKEIKS